MVDFPDTHAAADPPGRPAYIMADSGTVVTYRELVDDSRDIAKLLWSRGLRHGDCVAVLMENSAPFPKIAWAAQRIGLRYVTLSTRLLPDEVAYILGDSGGARALFTSVRHLDAAADAADAVPGGRDTDLPSTVPAGGIREPFGSTGFRSSRGRAGRMRGCRPAVLVRHHRPAQGGGRGGTAAAPARNPPGGWLRCCTISGGVRPGQCLPVPPGAAVSRCAAALHDDRAPVRRYRDRNGAIRPGAGTRTRRTLPGDPHPDGAHHVHPDAQAAGRAADRTRRVVAAGGDPRRRAVPPRTPSAP